MLHRAKRLTALLEAVQTKVNPGCEPAIPRRVFQRVYLVNFGLPANVVRGKGFGVISKTNVTSRQLQFSFKVTS